MIQYSTVVLYDTVRVLYCNESYVLASIQCVQYAVGRPARKRMKMDCRFYKTLPKAELHAHLHGCIRPQTLAELVRDSQHLSSNGSAQDVIVTVLSQPGRSLSDCFRIFDLIHDVVRDASTVRRITAEAVADFAADGVKYLELRTTPRPLGPGDAGEDDASLDRYALAVLETLAEIEAEGKLDIVVRVLFSVNRTSPVSAAECAIRLASRYKDVSFCVRPGSDGRPAAFAETSQGTDSDTAHTMPSRRQYGPYVVGVDLSGDPTRGSAVTFFPALASAREAGLRISIHAGEVMNVAETEAVIAWRPDRLGHMCVLAPATVALLMSALRPDAACGPPIPIEICPTSNFLTLHLPTLQHHPTLEPWLRAGWPVSICTDDSGVFNVTLSGELERVAAACDLSPDAVAALALSAFSASFADATTKAQLVARAARDAETLLRELRAC
jgi:adenosine deaminase